MHTLKLKILLAAFLALPLCVAFADPVSDHITVTVRGNGPDVLLIPGLASSSAVWDATARQLENRFRLHLIQVAGFAGSPPRANTNGAILQPAVDAIDLYIRTNHLKSPKIIGHSLGGLAGMMLATQHPEDVGKLMVVDALPFFGVLSGANDVAAATPGAAAMRDYVLTETLGAYAQSERQFLPSLVKSPAGQKAAIDWAIASDKSVVARAMYEDMTTDIRSDLHKIKSPVTILYPWDAMSGFPREATDKLYRDNFAALPDRKLVCIEDSFHFIMLDQPEKFAAQVDTFLK
ncbi:MAG: alpha/beta hydrolase [Verrucomicrobia bacterium]|nr:alpha/beta hydrolase [Verrucomicrobiota bacterium]